MGNRGNKVRSESENKENDPSENSDGKRSKLSFYFSRTPFSKNSKARSHSPRAGSKKVEQNEGMKQSKKISFFDNQVRVSESIEKSPRASNFRNLKDGKITMRDSSASSDSKLKESRASQRVATRVIEDIEESTIKNTNENLRKELSKELKKLKNIYFEQDKELPDSMSSPLIKGFKAKIQDDSSPKRRERIKKVQDLLLGDNNVFNMKFDKKNMEPKLQSKATDAFIKSLKVKFDELTITERAALKLPWDHEKDIELDSYRRQFNDQSLKKTAIQASSSQHSTSPNKESSLGLDETNSNYLGNLKLKLGTSHIYGLQAPPDANSKYVSEIKSPNSPKRMKTMKNKPEIPKNKLRLWQLIGCDKVKVKDGELVLDEEKEREEQLKRQNRPKPPKGDMKNKILLPKWNKEVNLIEEIKGKTPLNEENFVGNIINTNHSPASYYFGLSEEIMSKVKDNINGVTEQENETLREESRNYGRRQSKMKRKGEVGFSIPDETNTLEITFADEKRRCDPNNSRTSRAPKHTISKNLYKFTDSLKMLEEDEKPFKEESRLNTPNTDRKEGMGPSLISYSRQKRKVEQNLLKQPPIRTDSSELIGIPKVGSMKLDLDKSRKSLFALSHATMQLRRISKRFKKDDNTKK